MPTGEMLGSMPPRRGGTAARASGSSALHQRLVRTLQSGTREAEPAQPGLHFGNAHEQLPQQPGAMVLDHDDDRPLVDGQEGVGVPVALLAEGIDESVRAPRSARRARRGNAAAPASTSCGA